MPRVGATFMAPAIRSLREHVMEEVRTAIIQGRIKPGERLVEAELAAAFEVSRGCVREALRGLEKEGLVVSTPYRETRVATTSEQEVVEVLLPVRVVVEVHVLRQLAGNLTPPQTDALEQTLAAMRSAAAAADRRRLTELDIEFHRLLLSFSANPAINSIWAGIDARVRGKFLLDTLATDDPGEVVRIHEEYLDVLRDGEGHEIGRAVVRHIYGRLPKRLMQSGAPLAARVLVETLDGESANQLGENGSIAQAHSDP